MDIFAHIIWTYILSRGADWWTHAVVFAMAPDIVYLPATMILRLRYAISCGRFPRNIPRRKEYPEEVNRPYEIAHSFVTLLLFAIITFILNPNLVLPLVVGYGIHLLMDILTHRAEPGWAAPKPLFPFSNFSLSGVAWWRSPSLMAINWITILAILIKPIF